MPKSKNPDAYPYTYRDFIETAFDNGELEINFETKQEAKKLQFDLYGFKAALAHEGDSLFNKAAKIVLTVEMQLSGGYNLAARNSLDMDINDKILNAISKKKTDTQAIASSSQSEVFSNLEQAQANEHTIPAEKNSENSPANNQAESDAHESALTRLGYTSKS